MTINQNGRVYHFENLPGYETRWSINSKGEFEGKVYRGSNSHHSFVFSIPAPEVK